jgi:hypothetical protein
MTITTVSIVLGLLISAACIGIPQLVRIRNRRSDDDDTRAYLDDAGRSAQDVSQRNAAELQEEIETSRRSQPGP